MSNPLRHALVSFKEQLERRQQERRTERIARTRAEQEHEPLGNVPLATSPDVKMFFQRIKTSVELDTARYAHEALALDAAARASAGPEAGGIAPLPLSGLTALAGDGEPDAAALVASVSPSVHIIHLWESWNRVENLVPNTPERRAPHPSMCAALLMAEVTHLLQEQAQKPLMPASMLMKVKQSVQGYLDGRTNDTVTLLKNVLHNDPHNHSVLMMLSQILYSQAARGVQNALPEAREYAQRSTIYSDKVSPAQLAIYRYLAIATERAFGPERALEWLRETSMLNVQDMLDSGEGIMADRGMYLRGWALLSTIPVDLWQEAELANVKNLVTKAIGGVAIYMAWLRSPMLAAAHLSKLSLPHVDEIEIMLKTAMVSYAEHATALKQLPLKTSDKPWLLRVRFLNALVQVSPVPAFDQAMLQIALDGQSWNEGGSPDPELRATLGLREISYWRLWALVLTPFKDIRQPYLLPAEETIHDGDMLASCDQLLSTLAATEKQLIKAHLWDDLKPWLVRWQLDHLLAASTGSNKPRNRFAPSLPPYTGLYRIWQDPPINGLLPSDIIAECAKRGAFASLFEVLAALDGAGKLINDPVHGLIASQKRALTAANRYNPKKFKTVAAEFGSSSGNSLLILIMPVV
ncbi:MAG: hypothetical protein EON60_00715 [Alphaproteobacteria bacterium]|nr:MAG: hypothetical protein EON60_00715 [Alphaproteobacteria bacterium]